MAKANQQTTSQNPETDPNAPKQGDAPSLWSAEDMARLDKQMSDVAIALSDVTQKLTSLDNRFTSQEMKLANVDLGEGILPAEVADGVSPAQVYTAALQAAIIGLAVANPIGLMNTATRGANIKNCFDTAEAAMNESLRRSALRRKK